MTQPTMALQAAIAHAAQAREEFERRCLIMWRLVETVEPTLASEIGQLGFEDEAAAAWICSPLAGFAGSPAEMVAAGRGEEILTRIRQTMHGFVS